MYLSNLCREIFCWVAMCCRDDIASVDEGSPATEIHPIPGRVPVGQEGHERQGTALRKSPPKNEWVGETEAAFRLVRIRQPIPAGAVWGRPPSTESRGPEIRRISVSGVKSCIFFKYGRKIWIMEVIEIPPILPEVLCRCMLTRYNSFEMQGELRSHILINTDGYPKKQGWNLSLGPPSA